ncbi:MAG: hypothetical protein HPY52_03840 [Firmicutes bacterium]|nr:hypothetical protein [Bacillota bacterium]
MELRVVDYLANSGNSPLHRAAPWSKLLGVAMVLIVIIVSRNPALIGFILAVQLLISLLNRTLTWPVASIAAYPLLFGVLFAISQARNAPMLAVLVILKGVAAGLMLATLMVTTSYIDVFATLARIMPKPLVEMLFMAYRGFFLLVDRLEGLMLAVKLRRGRGIYGAIHGYYRGAQSLGALVLSSFDLMERVYMVMELRGIEPGNMRGHVKDAAANGPISNESCDIRRHPQGRFHLKIYDLMPLAAGVVAIVGLVMIH